jgi:low affinity Fe/Cu permease
MQFVPRAFPTCDRGARKWALRRERLGEMANHSRTKESNRNKQERDFFCMVRDAFRSFAQRSSTVLGSAWAFCAAVLIIVLWLVTGPTFHFSDTWQLIINTATTVVTFLMVFLIQNTQNRDAKVMQLKLDELLRASKRARTELVHMEAMSDEDLDELQQELLAYRDEAAQNIDRIVQSRMLRRQAKEAEPKG